MLAYTCEDIFDLRIYVTVTSLYPQDRGDTNAELKSLTTKN